MTLTDAIASYKNYLKTEYPRSIPTTDAELVRNSLLYLLANKDSESITSVKPTPSTPVDGTVGTKAIDLATAKSDRTAIFIHNNGAGVLKLNFGADVTATSCIYTIDPGQTLREDSVLASLRISAIADAANTNYSYIEVL